VAALAVPLILAWYLIFVAPYESTDDAFIEGWVTLISPRVPGLVAKLRVADNQRVTKGDVIVEIDPKDFETRLARARADLANAQAQLEQAKAQVAVDEAKAEQQHAAVLAAEAEALRAEADLKRYESVESRAVSATQLTLARTQARSTSANVEVARNQAKSADAQASLSQASVGAARARVEQNRASLDQALLDLSYTKVLAPVSGRVTRRIVEEGVYVQTGQSLLALVPEDVWVVANFKETQLERMRPGQPVRIRVDAFPGRDFKGKVDSLQSGTGARFSLLPPENAVGNYVKVVQRVPVKIVFDPPVPPDLPVAPGMSVVPEVRVK
jgi:membrane fusion protein (multidrug efflux system)